MLPSGLLLVVVCCLRRTDGQEEAAAAGGGRAAGDGVGPKEVVATLVDEPFNVTVTDVWGNDTGGAVVHWEASTRQREQFVTVLQRLTISHLDFFQ